MKRNNNDGRKLLLRVGFGGGLLKVVGEGDGGGMAATTEGENSRKVVVSTVSTRRVNNVASQPSIKWKQTDKWSLVNLATKLNYM